MESNDGVTAIYATSSGAVTVDFTATPQLHIVSVTSGNDGSNHATTVVTVEFELIGSQS